MIRSSAAVSETHVEREEGARLSREELSDSVYGTDEPTPIQLLLDQLGEWFQGLTAILLTTLPGGWWTLAPLLVLLLVLAVLLLVRLSPARRTGRQEAVLESGSGRTAADHRRRAEELAAAGEHARAIRERLRAVNRDLEDRVILAPRAGRTATELAAEAGTVLPDEHTGLHEAARLFNEVAYGDRPATEEGYLLVRDLDERLRAARPRYPEETETPI